MIHIQVVEATDIPDMDLNGKADPYCLIYFHSREKPLSTGIIFRNKKPVWNQNFHLASNCLESDKLCFKLMDYDHVTPDDPISSITIKLSNYPIGTVIDKWYNMEPEKGVSRGGRLRLKIHVAKSGETPFRPNEILNTNNNYKNDKNIIAQIIPDINEQLTQEKKQQTNNSPIQQAPQQLNHPNMIPQQVPQQVPQQTLVYVMPQQYPQMMMQPGMQQCAPMMMQPGMQQYSQTMMQPGMQQCAPMMMQPGMQQYPQMMMQPGMQQYTPIMVQQIPMQQYSSAPIQGMQQVPMQQYAYFPMQGMQQFPAQQYAQMQGMQQMPLQQYSSAPVQGMQQMPIQQAQNKQNGVMMNQEMK